MSLDPTQNRSQGNIVNHPAQIDAVTEEEDNSLRGLPKQSDEEVEDEDKEIVEDESTPEDYEKFNLDSVDELKKSKNEPEDN